MKDNYLINNDIKFYDTPASLHCTLMYGFQMKSHASHINDNTGIWDVDAQGHGIAYAPILTIEYLQIILPYISKVLNSELTINTKESKQDVECLLLADGSVKEHIYISKDNQKQEEAEFCRKISAFIYGVLYYAQEIPI